MSRIVPGLQSFACQADVKSHYACNIWIFSGSQEHTFSVCDAVLFMGLTGGQSLYD